MGVPAVGVLSGVVVLHEPMSWSIAFGMALIFVGIFIVLGFGAGRQRAADQKPTP
jgi:drug/metabolite transporter (DMT)-like permease